MTHPAPKKTTPTQLNTKSGVLDLLSKKLGCSLEDISFLFQREDAFAKPQDLTIPNVSSRSK